MTTTTKQSRCARCGLWRALAHQSKYCRDCIALLESAIQRIEETADKAKVQAYRFWANGGANFINGCKNNISERKVCGIDRPAPAQQSITSSP